MPAVCTALVADDAERVICAGTTRSGGGEAVGSRSRFGVASVSKAFTAILWVVAFHTGAVYPALTTA